MAAVPVGCLRVVDLADEGSVVSVVAEGEEHGLAGLPVVDEPADVAVAVGELLRAGDVVRPKQGLGLGDPDAAGGVDGRVAIDMSLARAENMRSSCPSTRAVWTTSSWPNPWPGSVSGGCSSQCRRSGDQAWPMTPRSSAGPWLARAVISMCQPSPSGSGKTHGSRKASSCHCRRRASRTSADRPEARGCPGCFVQVSRSSEVA